MDRLEVISYRGGDAGHKTSRCRKRGREECRQDNQGQEDMMSEVSYRGVLGLEYNDLTTGNAKIANKAHFYMFSVFFVVRSSRRALF